MTQRTRDCIEAGKAHSFEAGWCQNCGLDLEDFLVSNGTITVADRLYARHKALMEYTKRQSDIHKLMQRLA
jgi:hypothetical protein